MQEVAAQQPMEAPSRLPLQAQSHNVPPALLSAARAGLGPSKLSNLAPSVVSMPLPQALHQHQVCIGTLQVLQRSRVTLP